ncbi:MAG: cupin domain-containing protein [Sciscionella sp.]|nr:cupin domain-containing protein [Sciscionella sp.]
MSFLPNGADSNGADPDALVTVRQANEQRLLGSQRSGTRFVAPGSATEGRFGLFEYTMTAHADGPGPHYHRGFGEAFYILSGELEVLANEVWTPAGAGDFVYVPPRGVHGFRNRSDDDVRFLILFAPGIARERYFEGLAELRAGGRTPTVEEIDAFAAEHDQFNIR